MSNKVIVKVLSYKHSVEKRELPETLATEYIFKNDSPLDVRGVEVSDGYHTFEELYDHRITLFIALCRNLSEVLSLENPGKYQVWRSKINGDGSTWEGWFVMGIGLEKGKQITYHLPLSRWEETEFAETLDKAPEFDGHTSNDVLERLKQL